MIWLELNELCMGCMQQKTDQADKCSFCSFVEGTEPESPLHLPPRTILLNKYLIGKVLGQGGFGITYLAWDLNLNVKIAIKEYFPQELATRAAGHSQVSAYTGSMGTQYEYGLDKFLQEARTLAQFEGHPNIVSVRDFFKANGTAYFVMSYVDGITVKEHLAYSGGVLPLDQAHGIIMPVLDALKEVHSVNVLHRDISPDNIFINQKGQVILIDFGAARQAASEKGHSMSIILKPGYAPEEQYRSKGVQGPWTDIYAVGATFYHLITGIQPPEALERMVVDELKSPRALGVPIGEAEEKGLLTALAIRAADRYQTVADFQAVLMGKHITAGPPAKIPTPALETKKQTVPEKSKKSSLGIMIGAAAVVIAGVAVFALWSGGFLGSDTATLTEEPQEDLLIAEGEGEKTDVIIEKDEVASEEHDQDNQVDQSAQEETGEEEEKKEVTEAEEEEKTTADKEKSEEAEESTEDEQPKDDSEKKESEKDDSSSEFETISWDRGTYEGPLKNGVPHGKGTWVHRDGTSYVGDFYEGRIEGYGEYTFPNGVVYIGELKNGKAHGEGIMIHPDGRRVGRHWVNGVLQED